MSDIKYPKIKVKLTGTDGNAFSVMGRVSTALRRGGVPDALVAQYHEESMAGDYDHLLATAMEWVTVT